MPVALCKYGLSFLVGIKVGTGSDFAKYVLRENIF
jgi:hypothetical protein